MTPNQRLLVAKALEHLMLHAADTAPQEWVRAILRGTYRNGAMPIRKMSTPQLRAAYIDWANAFAHDLYDQMKTMAPNQRDVEKLIVAHASLVLPDWKP